MPAPSEPLTQEAIDAMLVDVDKCAKQTHTGWTYYADCANRFGENVRALAAEVKRMRTEEAAWRSFNEQADKTLDKADAEISQLRAELEAAQAYGDQQRNRAKTAELQAEAIANEAAQLRADLAAAKATIATLTTEEQKWRDSFFTAIAKRDTLRLALSSIENDICDEPFQGLEAPCGCCRSHIKTARRALDE